MATVPRRPGSMPRQRGSEGRPPGPDRRAALAACTGRPGSNVCHDRRVEREARTLRLHLPKRAGRIGLLAMASAGMLLMAGCSEKEQTSIKRLAQPVGATDRTESMHNLWMGSWLAAMLIGVL